MSAELRKTVENLREQLRMARTVYVVLEDKELVCWKDKNDPAIFSSPTDAELFCAKEREKYDSTFTVITMELK